MKKNLPFLASVVSLLVGLTVLPVDAVAQRQEPKRDAKSLQRELAKKKKELKTVAANRRKIDSQRGRAASELRAVEERVGVTARNVAVTQQKISAEVQSLGVLNGQQQTLRLTLGGKEAERRELLKAAYRQNRSGPLKAFLSQDRIADANRTLRYHRYLQQDRTARIDALNTQLKSLDQVQRQIQVRKSNLLTFQGAQQRQVAQLQKDRAQRDQVVRKLNAQFADAKVRETALGKDVNGLNKLLAELRAAAARAEAERRAAAKARAKRELAERRERERLAKRNAAVAAQGSRPTGTQSSVRSTEASAPVSTQPIRKPQLQAGKRVASVSGPSVGGMGWPANGSLLAGFGGQMPDGRRSSGLLIGAPQGSSVRAVAAGVVAYAQWMTGYGQLIIVDHGDGRMSLYAYNEALLKQVGDRVSRGEAIATVGNSGGHGRPAVYFELRSNGAPVNPRSMMN